MFTKKLLAAAAALGVMGASAAHASPLPAYSDSYEGVYTIDNAFSGHGLYAPSLIDGSATHWTVEGDATFEDNMLVMEGQFTNNNNTALKLDYYLKLNANDPSTYRSSPYCGGNCSVTNASDTGPNDPNAAGAQAAADAGVIYLSFDASSRVTGVDGTATAGLELGVTQMLGPNATVIANDPKYPQFGWGANWTTGDFGFSSWIILSEIANPNQVNVALGGTRDFNFTFGPNGGSLPGTTVPVPAGLPLIATAFGILAFVRRKKA